MKLTALMLGTLAVMAVLLSIELQGFRYRAFQEINAAIIEAVEK